MKNAEIIVGLDIGTTKIAVLVGRKDQFGKVEILGSGKTESIGVKRGVVANIENTTQSIIQAVKEASEKSGVNIATVYVGIAGQHIKSLQHRGSIIRDNGEQEISQKDVDLLADKMHKLAVGAGDKIIDVIPQDYIIDGETGIKQPIGIAGITLEANFHIITGQVTAALNIKRCIEKANLAFSGMIIEPIASAEAVLSEEEKEAGVVLVDIGGGTTDIAIFKDNILKHTAVIPFGGDIITEDVKEGCSIIKKQAEELKIKFGSALARENRDDQVVAIPGLRGRPPKEITLKNLANIIQARMEEIIEHVDFEIKNSGVRKLNAGIVLTGGGALLKHVVQLTEFKTGMETRIGYPNENISGKVSDELASPMYSTGIGVVLIGFNREKRALADERNEDSRPEQKPDTVQQPSKRKKFIDWWIDFFDKEAEK
ncbi:MAG: cell division protein FtsA [Lentimicrobiaceae bacterium]|nr:cell division protein FtsA [Lentimicrobiaceae bacterium]